MNQDGLPQDTEICNQQNEFLFIGCLYKQPDLMVEYSHYVREKYDFSDQATRFYYECALVLFKRSTQQFTKSNIMIFMAEDSERLATYKKFGGWKVIEFWMNAAVVADVKNYFEVLKKYSLLREYQRSGYAVDRIMKFKNFEMLTAADVYKIIRGRADKINTVIMGDVEIEVLNSHMSDMVDSCLESPDVGFEIPFAILNDVFRGMQRKTIMAVAAMSNAGKSRLMIKLVAYATLVLKEKTLIMLNEMTVDKMRKALLTTVINNPEYRTLHGVNITKPEKEIVLGQYRDSNGDIIFRKTDSDGMYTESLEDYRKRIEAESEEYRKVKAIAQWIENETQETMLVKDMSADYSDQALQFEIRKAVMTHGVKMWFYDTCKNEQTGEWAAFKMTVTALSELCKPLNVFGYLSMQLTDDTNAIMPDDMNSSCIAEAKSTKHVLDSLIMIKEISKRDYHKYEYSFDDPEWGSAQHVPLNNDKRYYCFVVDKNRGGEKPKLLYEIDLNLNTWREVGLLHRKARN